MRKAPSRFQLLVTVQLMLALMGCTKGLPDAGDRAPAPRSSLNAAPNDLVPLTDLVTEFPFARRHVEIATIDIGSPAAGRFLGSGWSDGTDAWKNADGTVRTVSWALGARTDLEVFTGHVGPLQMKILAQPIWFDEAPPQKLDIEVDGEPDGSVVLPQGMAWTEVTVPSERFTPGVHVLTIRPSFSRKPRDAHKGAIDDRDLATAFDKIEFPDAQPAAEPAVVTGKLGPRLRLPVPSQVDYFLDLPAGAFLRAAAIVAPGSGLAKGAGLELEVQAAGHFAIRWRLAPTASPVLRDLALTQGGRVRVSLRAIAGLTDADDAAAFEILRPEIVGPATEAHPAPSPIGLASAGKSLAPGPEGSPPFAEMAPTEAARDATRSAGAALPQNILVFLVDTLRPDHLGTYGYARPTSPQLDAFANEALVFEHAWAAAPWTKPSVAAILTGLNPRQHGVNHNDQRLADGTETLARRLDRAGFESAAFVTNINGSDRFGFQQGFDHFTYFPEKMGSERPHLPADQIVEKTLAWLDARKENEPFFLWLHVSDPHDPYSPPEAFRAAFGVPKEPVVIAATADLQARRRDDPGGKALRQPTIDAYDAEIAATDAAFGELIVGLRAQNLLDSTLVVVLSDHGEEFFEHGWWLHSRTLHEESIRIPLLMRFPDGFGAGERSALVARHIDIMPTLLAHAGLETAGELPGRDLRAAVRGKQTEVEAELLLDLPEVRHAGLVRPPLKLIQRGTKNAPPSATELYRLDDDPGETSNLAPTQPIDAARMLSELQRAAASGGPKLKETPVEITAELRSRLKALGYAE